jgi:diguanylate cyclase (GGDEF)-like protein
VRWSYLQRPQNLAFVLVVAALFGITLRALYLADRLAQTSASVGRGDLLLSNLDALTSVLWTLMAGIVLLMVIAFVNYRSHVSQRPVTGAVSGRGRAPSGTSGGEAALLGDSSRLLQSSVNFEDAFRVVPRCAAALFAGWSGALYLLQEPGDKLEIKASWGRKAGSRSSFEAAECWALRRGEAYLAAGAAAIACAHMQQPLRSASLCVPIMAQGSVLGMLLLENDATGGIPDSLRPAAENFSGQIGLALANMKLQSTLRNLSVHDPLTGVFNRRYMEESLNREIASAQRKSRPLGVAICNLDRFSRFNDAFGRGAGDFALREIAQLIHKHIRSSDIACRYGGDEIALIFAEAPLEAVVMRANKLRETIFALDLEYFGRPLGKISASFGVALLPQHGKTSIHLLREAERAVKIAKTSGGNRVEIAPVRAEGG